MSKRWIGLAIVVAVGMLFPASAAAPRGCPNGSVQIGERRVDEGNVIGVHPLCRRKASGPARNKAAWTLGTWRRGGSVANVLGTCYSNWQCHPAAPILRGADSQLRSTPLERHQGACAAGADPETCGTCMPISRPASASCQTCVEPKQCAQQSLGWRTRERLGCCYLNN